MVNNTEIQNLPLSTLSQLKYLNCTHNELSEINVSNNPLLEDFYVMHWVDDWPDENSIDELDLSNNPNLRTLIYRTAGDYSYYKINLNNGNNNPEMYVDISMNLMGPPDPDHTPTACIKVDDPEAAQNNGLPYSEWTFHHQSVNYDFTDDLEDCVLSVDAFDKPNVTLYPNPARDRIHFENINRSYELKLYDLSGKVVLVQKVNNASASANISKLSAGLYLYKLSSEKGIVKSGRLVKK